MLLLGLAALGIWAYLLAGRGGFWLLPRMTPHAARQSAARITAVIPARDEAAGIARTITSLLRQDHPGPFKIVLIDDHSDDGTARLASDAAAAMQAADRLSVLSARPLPPGWSGKLWAISEGLAAINPHDSDFILLTDADIVHAPENVGRLAAAAEAEGLDLLSQMVLLHCRGWWERFLIPPFVFFFFMLYPPRWVARSGSATAAAAGGCMLIRPAALARIGGIAAIRDALIDDCALAAAVKRTGGKIRLEVTREAQSTRVYTGANELWRMIKRAAFTQLDHSALLLCGTIIGLAITYVAPPALALFGTGSARLFGVTAWIAMAAALQPTLRLYRCSPFWGVLLPACAVFYSAATVASAFDYWAGRGGQWKGRVQAARS